MNSVKCTQCGLENWTTVSSCKGCGAKLNGSGSLSETRASFSDSGYPQGSLPHKAKQGEAIKPCLHCGKELGLKKWDNWNGFLIECPHCGGLHGKRWNVRRVLLASFIFNALSFLFTMRPAKAALALSGFVVFAIIGNYLLDNEQIPDILEIVGVILFILGPMLINAIILIKHERDLDNSAPPTHVQLT